MTTIGFQMKSWQLLKYRKESWKEFWKQYIPEHIKTPVVGKYAILTTGQEEYFRREHENPYQACMVVEVFASNRPLVNILNDESIITIATDDISDWLYCSVTDKLKGKNIAITGTTIYPRAVYENIIAINGGTYKNGVGRKTTHLINSNSGDSSKIKRAKEHKVQLINEVDFFKMIE